MAFLLDVIAPIFLLIGCGYLLGRRRSVDPAPLADVAIYICLPFLMFAALVRHPVTGTAAAQTFAWQVGMYVVSMPVIALVAHLAGWDKPTRSAVTLSLPTVNIASYGVPVVLFAFGDEALAIVMLLFVYGNVTAASLGTYIAAGGRQSPLQAFKSIFRLPLIYTAVLALAVNALAVPIPVSILDAADLIGKAGPILAIILLGVQVSHIPTRGRNLLRVHGDLLAAHALGLRNLFVVMGDPTQVGDYPEAMDLYDLAPSALIHLIRQRLNRGLDQAGHSIGQPTSFTVGCALNMNASSAEREIRVLLRKLQGGASFALGQAIFEPEQIGIFHEQYEALVGEPLRLPVLMGLMPLYSVKHARFLHNEVPGIHIPPRIIERMGDAGEDAPQEGLRIAGELLAAMRDQVQGTYIIPAFGRYDLAADLVEQARALAPA